MFRMLDKKSADDIVKVYFNFSPENWLRHIMQIVSSEFNANSVDPDQTPQKRSDGTFCGV